MNTKKSYKISGFTLVEILVAIVIMMIGIAPIISMVSSSSSGISRVSDQTQAVYIGKYILEKIIARSIYDFDGIVSEPESHCVSGVGGTVSGYLNDFLHSGKPIAADNFPELFEQIKTFTCVVDAVNMNPPGLKMVTVRIKWKFRGQNKESCLSTYVFKR